MILSESIGTKRQSIIIVIAPCKEPEAWGNLKKLCDAKGWKYKTLSKRTWPIEVGLCMIYRVPFH